MNKSWHIKRRTFLKGAGVSLALPFLEAMSEDVKDKPAVKRACYFFFANGISLPPEDNQAFKDGWTWFPLEKGDKYKLTKPLSPFAPFREKMTVLSGMCHHASPLNHTCGDVWLTAGNASPLSYYNSISVDQVIADKIGHLTREPFLTLSCDGGVGTLSRVSTISFNRDGKPIPSENSPRRIFDRLFNADKGSKESRRKKLQYKGRMIDMILEDSRSFNRKLGRSDREKMDEYLESVSSLEKKVERSEAWLDTAVKKVDTSKLELDVNIKTAPAEYYHTMFDLISLVLEADITRTVTFMMSREDGMGIADTFPTTVFGYNGHHAMSHEGGHVGGYLKWAKYDQWLSARMSYFVKLLENKKDFEGTYLDNTIVTYGSGSSSTHKQHNCPFVVLGGGNMGLKHGRHINVEDGNAADIYLTQMQAMGINVENFADSKGTVSGWT